MQPLLFMSSPPFFILALSFSLASFSFVSVILSLSGPRNLPFDASSLNWISKNWLDIHVYIFIIHAYLKELYLHNWVLSIQPKFRKFQLETRWNRPFRVGPTGIFAATFEGHYFDLSAHFGAAGGDGPFHLTKLLSPVLLFCTLLSRKITKCAVAWVGSVQPECNVPLGT